jgi:hypothetical protein
MAAYQAQMPMRVGAVLGAKGLARTWARTGRASRTPGIAHFQARSDPES